MTAFCRTHVKDRSDAELAGRYHHLRFLQTQGKLGPGLRKELVNVIEEQGRRRAHKSKLESARRA